MNIEITFESYFSAYLSHLLLMSFYLSVCMLESITNQLATKRFKAQKERKTEGERENY